MLLELRVDNYAVIDNVIVEFGPGLNLLTGETGAGKSILIDALALLLGEKASVDMVRHGADKAVIAAVFDGMGKQVAAILQEHGIDCENEQVILRREIGAKGRVFVNNQPATVAVLKQLAPELALVHAQNEALASFDASARRELLDTFAGVDSTSCTAAYQRWRDLHTRIAELRDSEQDRARLIDLWSFQKREIDAAKIEPREDERLDGEKLVLTNAEKIYSAAMAAYDALYDSNSSAAASLRAASRRMEELARYDARFHDMTAAAESARATVEDLGAALRDYVAGIDPSAERLAEIEDRLALLDSLKRKYGQTLDDVIAYGKDVAQKLEEFENRDEVLKTLEEELARAAEDYLVCARELSKRRRVAAGQLEKLVEAGVNELAMKARFHVETSGSEKQGDWSACGFDGVEYVIATNPGEPMRPVEQIASGGELSRVLLALKAAAESAPAHKRRGNIERTLIFDEIDNGIGGRAAETVGKKLKSLGRSNQVICVTHLPQIAAFADVHLFIQKKESQGRVRTTVRRLAPDERTEELARMLSGARLTETSRKHAEQMLKANA